VVASRENSRYRRPWGVDPEVMIHASDMQTYVDKGGLVFRFAVDGKHWDANEKDSGFRHTRATMMDERIASAARSRVELSLGHTRTKTPADVDLDMWAAPERYASTTTPRLPDSVSVPYSFRPPGSPTT